MERAVRDVRFEGNSLVQAAQRRTLDRLGVDYLLEEVLGVIEARRLESADEYRKAPRPGRRYALNETQRQAVWSVRDGFGHVLSESGRHTWEQVRAEAARHLASGGAAERYDAVVIDEAQDLSPAALEVLVRLCREPNRLFLTADANQSIYGGAFRWTEIHDTLRFQGRTGVLRANHRSTREIGEAAQSYLAGGVLDDEPVERGYAHSGPLPAVRAVERREDEGRLIARFFRSATRELRLGLGACAVLCPTNAGAQRLATALGEEGLQARYMGAKELDLGAPVVKTLTLKSAKGLEFPIVAIAGFLDGSHPVVPAGSTDEIRAELLARERRTLFVAMTRAMRGLLVVIPAGRDNELLSGFDPKLWNLGEAST
jgi:superfamily I DNA/RNA helicase